MSVLKQECLRDGDTGRDPDYIDGDAMFYDVHECEGCGYWVDQPGLCHPCHKAAEEEWMAKVAREEAHE